MRIWLWNRFLRFAGEISICSRAVLAAARTQYIRGRCRNDCKRDRSAEWVRRRNADTGGFCGVLAGPRRLAQDWAETVAALQPEVQLAPVPFANPCGVYEQLTVTYQGRTVTARVIRPAAAGRHPLLLMYHDLNRSVRGWHHMTRFLALGFGTVALESEPCKGDWQAKPAQADFHTRYLDALAVAKAALALPWVDADCVCTFGEGFGGGLALLAACLLPGSNAARRSIPCPAIFPVWVCRGARTLTLPILRRFAAPKYCWAAA